VTSGRTRKFGVELPAKAGSHEREFVAGSHKKELVASAFRRKFGEKEFVVARLC